MAATRVDGTGTNKRTPYLLYEVITNNATTYTLRLSLGVNNKNSGASGIYTATTESYISKKIGSGAAAFTYASSSVRVSYGDTVIISNTTWTITKTHASQSISIAGFPYLDHQTIGSVTKTLTVPAKTSYTVTYNANSGSGAPAQQTKWYGETLTLSSAKPTKAGYTFNGWATSEANAKAGTVAYAAGASYTGNAALTLWAVWELTYTKPQITGLSVERCLKNGTADDEGTYARVKFNWSVLRTTATRFYNGSSSPYSSNAVSSCVVTVGSESKTVSLSGASGSASVVIGDSKTDPFNVDTAYNASVSITDTQTIYTTNNQNKQTVEGVLAPAYFPLDFNADATAVGLFMPAPDNKEGVFLGKDLMLPFDTTAASGTTDGALYAALTALGWVSEVID